MQTATVTKEQVSEAITNETKKSPYVSDYRGM